jgi:hypothetical protein
MKKKKLVLNKETVKNLTLDRQELDAVAGGYIGGAGTQLCPTGTTCHSCGTSCLACPGGTATIYINPDPTRGG